MEEISLNNYLEERICEYKGRKYLVRDNGAILRLPKEGYKPSKLDNIWKFGTKNMKTGYMFFTGNVRVHQVVCSAFHGPRPQPNMVVDHIDTNRCNNRPENLRWVTRLDNALLNEYTRSKIIYLCGSVEAFLEDPSILRDKALPPSIGWMRTVSKEEAEVCKLNMDKLAKKGNRSQSSGKGIGDWVYQSDFYPNELEEEEEPNYLHNYIVDEIRDSLTQGAKQLNWRTPTEFLLCPAVNEEHTLQAYLNNIEKGKVFTRTQYGDGGVVLDYGFNANENSVFVLTYWEKQMDNPVGKPWALIRITQEDGYFVHQNCGSFFQEDGGLKYFTLAMGKEWEGGEVFDDGC